MYAIGLDIGGTKIEGVLARMLPSGAVPKVLKKVRLPTNPSAGKQAVLNSIAEVIVSLFSHGKNIRSFKLSGIGIGTAGFLKDGKLEMSPNIPCLEGVALKEALQQQLQKKGIKTPLFIENDSICFALAEFMFGAARDCNNVIGVIVGTGIGGGLILDGRLYRGRDGGAGHIGHVTIDPSGPKCGCGKSGHFEAWCSGSHITRRYIAAGGKIQEPNPGKIFRSTEKTAKKVMEETYEKFGVALAGLISTFNPEVIVLGGGVSNLPDKFYQRIAAATKKHSNPAFYSGVRILRNKLGDSAGVLGAAALVASEY